MSAVAVLDTAYACRAIEADELDRLIATAGGRKDGEPSMRRQLDLDLGLVDASTDGPLADLVPIGEFTLEQLAQRWQIA